jgi:hypothetical protein
MAFGTHFGVGNHHEMIDAFKIIFFWECHYIFFFDSNGILFFFKNKDRADKD